MATMMQCGHSANAQDDQGKPVCVICAGIAPGWDVPASEPDLTGRKAKCAGHAEVPSSTDLAFFSYQPEKPYDSYYCGHGGWD